MEAKIKNLTCEQKQLLIDFVHKHNNLNTKNLVLHSQ